MARITDGMDNGMAVKNGKGWALGIAAGLSILALAALYDRAFNRLPETIKNGDEKTCTEVENKFIRLEAKIAGTERVAMNERRLDTIERSRFVTSDQFTAFKDDIMGRLLEFKLTMNGMDKKLDKVLDEQRGYKPGE